MNNQQSEGVLSDCDYSLVSSRKCDWKNQLTAIS